MFLFWLVSNRPRINAAAERRCLRVFAKIKTESGDNRTIEKKSYSEILLSRRRLISRIAVLVKVQRCDVQYTRWSEKNAITRVHTSMRKTPQKPRDGVTNIEPRKNTSFF